MILQERVHISSLESEKKVLQSDLQDAQHKVSSWSICTYHDAT